MRETANTALKQAYKHFNQTLKDHAKELLGDSYSNPVYSRYVACYGLDLLEYYYEYKEESYIQSDA